MKRLALAMGVALFLVACTRSADRTLENEVQTQLTAAKLPGSISVDANDGVVTLTGTVPDLAVKEQARLVVAGITGVNRVINDLRSTTAADAPPHDPAAPSSNPPMND